MVHRWAAQCLLALVLAGGGTAAAQADEEPPEGYRERIDRAMQESAAGRWEEARVAFREAHALYPNARTLRGIGLVAFEIRDYLDAARSLRAALDEPRRALDPGQRAEAESLLQRSLALLARYETSALPGDATVIVDGRPARREPDGTLLLALGEHRVQVRSAMQTGEGLITVRGGEAGPLPIVLQTPPRQEPAPATAVPAPALAATAAQSDSPPTGAIVLTVAGAVVAVTGAVLLVMGLDDVSDVENAADDTEWASLRGANDSAPLLTGMGAGLLALGGALGVTGTVWLVSAGSGDEARPAAALYVGGRW